MGIQKQKTENEPYESSTLYWLNLNDGKQVELKAGYDEYITALGFMGEDLVYGLVKKEHVKTEASGNVLFPIYNLIILNQDNKVLKDYNKEDYYITDCSIADNQITLKRILMNNDGEYKYAEDDHIASSDVQNKNVTKVSTVSIDVYKKIVQLVLKNTTDTHSLKFMSPKEVIFEGNRVVNLDLGKMETVYYVYGFGGVEKITSSSAEAVSLAYKLSGSVVDEGGNYIWKKGTVYNKNQIMAITGTKKDNETSSLAVCLDTILTLEGISQKTQPMLDLGKDAMNILKTSLRKERILDLGGCPLDAVLYYLDQDIPVLALMNNREAYLITGFNEYNVVLMDPKSGMVYKKGMNDSREMFEENGNQFITYMRYE